MIRVHLINCQTPNLDALGISMEERGHPDLLTAKITEKINFEQGYMWHEYNFPPTELLIIILEDWAVIPDFSELGEVSYIEYPEGQ